MGRQQRVPLETSVPSLISKERMIKQWLNTNDAKMFRLYYASFKRLPDPSGLNYWLGELRSGAEKCYEALLVFAESTL